MTKVGKTKPQADLFRMVSLDQLVPTNRILRRIDAGVDFSCIPQQVADKCRADWARPSIDP